VSQAVIGCSTEHNITVQYSTVQYSTGIGHKVPTSALASESRLIRVHGVVEVDLHRCPVLSHSRRGDGGHG
jgi:hypothetical protein